MALSGLEGNAFSMRHNRTNGGSKTGSFLPSVEATDVDVGHDCFMVPKPARVIQCFRLSYCMFMVCSVPGPKKCHWCSFKAPVNRQTHPTLCCLAVRVNMSLSL